MTVAYRQPIVPHDRGLDVLATQRALEAMGHRKVARTGYAGHAWEAALRTVQSNHHLDPDGVYGRATHAVVAPHMDGRARYLYEHAKLRHRSDYRNPFSAARVVVGRIDEGVDYFGYGPIHAIGDCVIVGRGGSGWPGGQYLVYRLTSGRHAARYVYIAEGITIPLLVRAGRRFQAGDTLCSFRYDAAPGRYPGIEFGWSSGTPNVTWAAATHQLTPRPYNDTPPGLAFARFLRAVGAPAPAAGRGLEFV